MFEHYLNMFGPLVGFALLIISAVFIGLRGYPGPATLIGVPAASIVILKLGAAFRNTGAVEYMHGPEGEVLGATGVIGIWQQALFWVSPVAIIFIAVGLAWLAVSLPTLNKPLKSDAQKTRAL